MPTNNPVQYDVIIVGAGLAGLAAAKALGENGINYMIIEASSRAGGKVISRERPDRSRFFELGPQFVNEDMTEIVELIQEAGMDLRETDITSDSVEIDGSNKKAVELAFIDQILNEENIPFHEKDERLSDLYEKTIKDEQLKKSKQLSFGVIQSASQEFKQQSRTNIQQGI